MESYSIANSNKELESLGFNAWFQSQAATDPGLLNRLARIVEVHKDRYTVHNGQSAIPAEITGKLMFGAESPLDLPMVGDWVEVDYLDQNSLAIVHRVLDRRTLLKRKAAGRKIEYQPIAANIDTALIVQSLERSLNPRSLERYLVVANESQVRPVIALSKRDLADPVELEKNLGHLNSRLPGVGILAFSNTDSQGLDAIRDLLSPGETFCLLGPSGVGKTTLLNNLLGHPAFATRGVRVKDSKGKHTTTRRQLTPLPGGALVIDTPGMRELGNIGVETGLELTFDEIAAAARGCRFGDCTHTSEAGCGVLAALDEDRISEERYDNYIKMMRESAYHQRSYLEKRKQAKAFGKMIKSVKKQVKHRKGNF